MLVNTTAGTSGSAFYVRAAMCAASIASVPTDYDIFALAALRYTSTGSPLNTAAPTSTDWSDSNNADTTCQDFPDGNLVPFVKQNAPTSVLDSVILVRHDQTVRLTLLVLTLISELVRWYNPQFSGRDCSSLLLELSHLDQCEFRVL